MSVDLLFGRTPTPSARAGAVRLASRGVFSARGFGLAALVVLATWCAASTRPFVRGLSLVVRGAELQGVARGLSNVGTVRLSERVIAVPLRDGSVRGRLYLPLGTARQTVLLVPGLQIAGMDDPRIVKLARELAKSRVNVLTPDMPELSRFEITSALTDHIEDAALLRLRGQVDVRLLVTGLISHADADQPGRIIDMLELAGFWEDLLDR